MIMPANYSAIAENELSYVDGGWVDPMTTTKILETNIATAIGNTFIPDFMDAFISVWFKDDGQDSVFKLFGEGVKNLFANGVENQGTWAGQTLKVVRNTIGVLGAVWVLGTKEVYKPLEIKTGLFASKA